MTAPKPTASDAPSEGSERIDPAGGTRPAPITPRDKATWGQHRWKLVERFDSGGRQDECVDCGCERFFSYRPWWPGWFDYITASGADSVSQPRCEKTEPT